DAVGEVIRLLGSEDKIHLLYQIIGCLWKAVIEPGIDGQGARFRIVARWIVRRKGTQAHSVGEAFPGGVVPGTNTPGAEHRPVHARGKPLQVTTRRTAEDPFAGVALSEGVDEAKFQAAQLLGHLARAS